LPVKDGAKARGIMGAITMATAESGAWVQSEKDGVQYYSKPPVSPMLPIAPTVALSDRLFIVAQDPDFAEAIVKRSSSGRSQLAASAGLKAAERLVTEPKHGFSYLDSELLYNRLDAAVRPILVMAAAFMPRISDTVELGKVPAAEVVTKHLSRMVMSQRYETDGYLTEAVGPVSIYQAAIAISALTGVGARLYQNPPPSGMSSSPFAPAAPSLPATPAALPTATATETP